MRVSIFCRVYAIGMVFPNALPVNRVYLWRWIVLTVAVGHGFCGHVFLGSIRDHQGKSED